MIERGSSNLQDILSSIYESKLRSEIVSFEEGILPLLESPIERKLAEHLYLLVAATGQNPKWMSANCSDPINNILNPASFSCEELVNGVFTIVPQFKIGNYRVDFLIIFSEFEGDFESSLRHRLVLVECDGHDFHERTKEQAARDRSRDRFLQLKGYRVLRFTGSEIHNNAIECINEIWRAFVGDGSLVDDDEADKLIGIRSVNNG